MILDPRQDLSPLLQSLAAFLPAFLPVFPSPYPAQRGLRLAR